MQTLHERVGQIRAVGVFLAAAACVGSFFALAVPAAAATSTLYVSNTGANSGTCTSSAAPCATVSYALTQLNSPGETILIAGTIDDNVLINNTSVEIAQDPGGSPAELDGEGKNSVITVEGSSILRLNQVTVTGGSATSGGGIFVANGIATINDSSISGNTATSVGGGVATSAGSIVLNASTVSGNTAKDAGGGIGTGSGPFRLFDSTVSGNTVTGPVSFGQGGGIDTSLGGGVILDSTISHNTVEGGGASGGGLFVEGGSDTVLNSTISDNTAAGPGGGITANGVLDISDSTISGNTASSSAAIDDVGNLSMAGDILATRGGPPVGGECVGVPSYADFGYNVDDDGTCHLSSSNHSVSDSTTIGSFLGPLQDNGGPTETIALIAGIGNPAQAVIPSTFTPPGATGPSCSQSDQRGVARGVPCDMGAFAVTHGYWLVGADGGIFTFGSAQFYGSTGNLHLQRPVVGISPTSDRAGYWLVASDGGVFTFGDAGFYGSIPGLGFAPAGSAGSVKKLNAPVVGIVPSADGGGYFMVASDGGVFAFGDAHFAGSCPGLVGGCSGAAVAVMPDASGNGYWVVTATGHVYTFGDANYYGAPGPQGVPVTSAVRTPDGKGYWILFANGAVGGYGDAANLGSPLGLVGGINPATAIFTTADGGGYWVTSAAGAVYQYGDATNDGSMAGQHLNAPIIAGTGW